MAWPPSVREATDRRPEVASRPDDRPPGWQPPGMAPPRQNLAYPDQPVGRPACSAGAAVARFRWAAARCCARLLPVPGRTARSAVRLQHRGGALVRRRGPLMRSRGGPVRGDGVEPARSSPRPRPPPHPPACWRCGGPAGPQLRMPRRQLPPPDCGPIPHRVQLPRHLVIPRRRHIAGPTPPRAAAPALRVRGIVHSLGTPVLIRIPRGGPVHTWPSPRPTHGHAASPRLPHGAQHVALMLCIVAALVLALIDLLT
jgi:hypothetical protein